MSHKVIVQPGETLSRIARREGVPLKDLKEANSRLCQESSGPKRDKGCNWIYPGDEVVIPRSTGEKSPSAIAERAWRGISGAFARAAQFVKERLPFRERDEVTIIPGPIRIEPERPARRGRAIAASSKITIPANFMELE